MTRTHKAYVKNGRLVLDEATTLPEGEVVELVRLDEAMIDAGDELDDEERERLLRAIDEGMEDARAGRTVDALQFIEELRAEI